METCLDELNLRKLLAPPSAELTMELVRLGILIRSEIMIDEYSQHVKGGKRREWSLDDSFVHYTLLVGFIHSKTGDGNDIIRNVISHLLGKIREIILEYNYVYRAFVRACKKLYESTSTWIIRKIYSICKNPKLTELSMRIFNLLLLLPENSTVLNSSFSYWAKIGARFGFLALQDKDKLVNDYLVFVDFLEELGKDANVEFSHYDELYMYKEMRKLFIDTLIEVYEAYVTVAKDYNLPLGFIEQFTIVPANVISIEEATMRIESYPSVYTISAGWVIYDPIRQDFIFRPQCEAPIRGWIDKRNPLSYWLAICITNTSDQPINCFEVEFEVSSLLEVKSVHIEGFEEEIPFYKERGSRIGMSKYVITFPEELGVSIPRGGSRRIYIDIHSKVCGQRFIIENGKIKTENFEVKLNDLDFWYSCELLNIYEQHELASTPEGKRLIERKISIGLRNLDENTIKEVIKCCNNVLELADEGVKTAMKYVNNLIILRNLIGDTDFYKWLYNGLKVVFAHKVSKSLDQLMEMPDYEVQLSDDILTEIRKILIDAIKHL